MHSVEPQEDLSDALDLLAENSIHQTPVLYQGRLIGMLTRADIIDYLHRRKELGIEQSKS
ncbi:MAG: CBS domain-containing protein [Chloroflexi bacterium]|nr:CBS domain-containing protein [Chloroflexota bacterium]